MAKTIVARHRLLRDARCKKVPARYGVLGNHSIGVYRRTFSWRVSIRANISADENRCRAIIAAATPAAVPVFHSIGWSRVAEFAMNVCAIVLPATKRLSYDLVVSDRNGMKNGSGVTCRSA
jgi:hypothetical protein